jgi:hypothetical protein
MAPVKELTPKRLIKALESGKYNKGQGELRTDDMTEVWNDLTQDFEEKLVSTSYCCLGVACDVVGVKLAEPTAGFINPFSLGIKKFFKRSVWEYAEDDIAYPPSFAPWLTEERQKLLANANDDASTFNPVINLLKEIDAEVTAERKKAWNDAYNKRRREAYAAKKA